MVGLLRDVPVPVRTTGASGSVATAAANSEHAISAQEIFGFCGNNNVIQLSGSIGRKLPHDKAMQTANYDSRLFLSAWCGVVG